MNFVLISAILAVLTTDAFAQGQLAANEQAAKPTRRFLLTRQTTNPDEFISSEGSRSGGLNIANLQAPADSASSPGVQPLVKARRIELTNAAWQDDAAAPAGNTSGGLAMDDPSSQSGQPQLAPSNMRAWVYETLGGDAENVSSLALAMSPISSKPADGGNAGFGNATADAGKSISSPEQSGLELIDEASVQRQIVSNIAMPEPGTSGLALIGGALVGWGRLRRRGQPGN